MMLFSHNSDDLHGRLVEVASFEETVPLFNSDVDLGIVLLDEGEFVCFATGGNRLRGPGGGTNGNSSNRAVSSWIVGIGVVRELKMQFIHIFKGQDEQAYSITTIWKSGTGGLVFLNGVDGL
jgi:hypothetical protein